MLILDQFSSLISQFEDKRFVFVLSEFVLIFENTLDNFSIESLILTDTLLHIHDDLSVGLLERFLFGYIGVRGFALSSHDQVLISSVSQCPDA
jgi:hypothetical protein